MRTAARPGDRRDPTAAALLDVWERGAQLSGTRRALALLSTATGAGDLEMLSIGARDAALLTLRERLFGPRVSAVVPCPGCGERQELSFHVEEVRAPEPDGGSDTGLDRHLSADGYEVHFRLPNSADLDLLHAEDHAEDHVDRAAATLLSACILSADPAELPATVVAAIADRMAELDPQADVELPLHCDACGTAWVATFDIASFLWSEIDAWAWRLLGEVHQLARAYGWSERDVLALSPRRRQIYLEVAAR